MMQMFRYLNTKLIYGLLACAVLISWGWLYVEQQRDKAQIAALLMQTNAHANTNIPQRDGYKDEAVKNTIRKHVQAIQKPWLAYLEKGASTKETQGVIEMDWQIEPNGQVSQVRVIHSDFSDTALVQGLTDVIASLQFPSPPFEQRTYISHKFNFKKEVE